MTNEELADAAMKHSVPCIKIEIGMSLQGPVVTASQSDAMDSPLLPQEIKDELLKVMDAAVKGALDYLRSSSEYRGEIEIMDKRRVLEEDNFFDPRKVVTLDVE